MYLGHIFLPITKTNSLAWKELGHRGRRAWNLTHLRSVILQQLLAFQAPEAVGLPQVNLQDTQCKALNILETSLLSQEVRE